MNDIDRKPSRGHLMDISFWNVYKFTAIFILYLCGVCTQGKIAHPQQIRMQEKRKLSQTYLHLGSTHHSA